ncbi:MAG: cold-shock protein [Francisellaceae bacterium]
MENRIEGTVKFYNETKGYGFISVPQGKDIFVHATQLANIGGLLYEGQMVSFEAREGKKGVEAVKVEIV